MIGTNTGEQYDSNFDHLVASYHDATMPSRGSTEPAGALKKDQGRVPSGPSLPSQFPLAPEPGKFQQYPLHVDREHDVPLAASALHKDGQFYGIAIDKDAPNKPEYNQYIYKHESDEFHYMKDLITNGMAAAEAYHKAHDHITPMESARVQADLGEKGLEDYKQYWRDVAKIASEKWDNRNKTPEKLKPVIGPIDRENTPLVPFDNEDLRAPDPLPKSGLNRHPDAHTTTHGLDEAELGKKYAMNDNFNPMNPMQPGYTNPGGHDSMHKVINPGRAMVPKPANENKDLEIRPTPYEEAQINASWNKLVKDANESHKALSDSRADMKREKIREDTRWLYSEFNPEGPNYKAPPSMKRTPKDEKTHTVGMLKGYIDYLMGKEKPDDKSPKFRNTKDPRGFTRADYLDAIADDIIREQRLKGDERFKPEEPKE